MTLHDFLKANGYIPKLSFGIADLFFTNNQKDKTTGRRVLGLDSLAHPRAKLTVDFTGGVPVTGSRPSAVYERQGKDNGLELTKIFCNARWHVAGIEKTTPDGEMTRAVFNNDRKTLHLCPNDTERHRLAGEYNSEFSTEDNIHPQIRDMIDMILRESKTMAPTLRAVCKAIVGPNNANDCEEIDDFFSRHLQEGTTNEIEFIFLNENSLTVSFKDGQPCGKKMGLVVPAAIFDDTSRDIHYALFLGQNGLVERCDVHTRNGCSSILPRDILMQGTPAAARNQPSSP